jgi:hypothetical protein
MVDALKLVEGVFANCGDDLFRGKIADVVRAAVAKAEGK